MIHLQGWVEEETGNADRAPAWLRDDEGGAWQCFAGRGWAFRARPDATYVVERLGDGVIIHDGRAFVTGRRTHAIGAAPFLPSSRPCPTLA